MAEPAPLAIDGELALFGADGEAVTVTATGAVIDVTLPHLRSRLWVMSPLADRSQRQVLLTLLQRGLRVADLTLRVKVRQHVVAQMRPHSQPTRLSRILGLGSVEVRVVPVLRALLGRSQTARSS
jgi:hypothetical protein